MAVGAQARKSDTNIEFCVTRADMEAFRRLSSDNNPIHDDPVFARRCGFADVVVYGGLIVAQVSRLLGTMTPGPGCIWRSVALKFRRPLYVDMPARLEATPVYSNETFRLVRFRLRVDAAGGRIADGEAEAQLAATPAKVALAHVVE